MSEYVPPIYSLATLHEAVALAINAKCANGGYTGGCFAQLSTSYMELNIVTRADRPERSAVLKVIPPRGITDSLNLFRTRGGPPDVRVEQVNALASEVLQLPRDRWEPTSYADPVTRMYREKMAYQQRLVLRWHEMRESPGNFWTELFYTGAIPHADGQCAKMALRLRHPMRNLTTTDMTLLRQLLEHAVVGEHYVDHAERSGIAYQLQFNIQP